jgi:hypothetical protein
MGIEKWQSLAVKPEEKISEESARAELGRLMAHYEIDMENIAEDAEPAINQVMNRVLSAFMAGKIELSEDKETGEPSIIQHITKRQGKETITFRALRGGDKPKLDSAGNDPVKRMHKLMGILSGLGDDIITKLSIPDLRITEALAGFFIILA